MRSVRLWDDYPRSREEALGRIREEIGANKKGFAYVDAPDKSVVEVDSNWVYKHFFVDHDRDRRWEYVPAIVPAIEESYDWDPVPERKGRVAYLSTLEIVRPNRKSRQHIQTIADQKSTRFKKWITTYPTRKGTPDGKDSPGAGRRHQPGHEQGIGPDHCRCLPGGQAKDGNQGHSQKLQR